MTVTDRGFNPSSNPDIDAIKAQVLIMEQVILDHTKPGRHRAIALTHLETASMYAVKSAAVGDG